MKDNTFLTVLFSFLAFSFGVLGVIIWQMEIIIMDLHNRFSCTIFFSHLFYDLGLAVSLPMCLACVCFAVLFSLPSEKEKEN